MTWVIYAFLSAVFGGLTALLAKVGVENISSNLATFIRTLVVVAFLGAIVVKEGDLRHISTLSKYNWTFLVLSGIATGLSWLCYFAALKPGPISGVAPIDKLSFVIAMALGVVVLREKVTPLTVAGAGFILLGVLLTLPHIQESVTKLFVRS